MSNYKPNFILVTPKPPQSPHSASNGNSAAKPVNSYGYPVRPFPFSFSQPSK